MNDTPIVLSTPEQIKHYVRLSQKYAMRLELKGLRHSRGSVIAFIKKQHGWKGNKESIYQQFCDHYKLERD